MRSKALPVLFLLLSAPVLVLAQNPRSALVVPLPDGGFVSFKSETTSVSENDTSGKNLNLHSQFSSQALIGENHVIHRVLVDASGRFLFGYDLQVAPEATFKKFRITVKPIDPEFERKLKMRSADLTDGKISTLPQSADPQVLNDGDAFALDLLINQETGVKIVDVVKVSFDRSQLWDINPPTIPRDFTLDAVEFRLKEHQLLVDGNLVSAGKPGSGISGALVWFYLEGKGRFIFSLVPREGYDFRKAGLVADNLIEFSWKGKRYQWQSTSPILPKDGTWNVWVLHDPKYTPFGTDETVQDEMSKWEKWEAAIKAAQQKAEKIGDPQIPTYSNDQPRQPRPPQRFRVMVGGADRMENLWPKK